MNPIDHDEVARLKNSLITVEQEFDRGMRERGFDPQQTENIALTASLAKLFAERDDLKAKLASMQETGEPENE